MPTIYRPKTGHQKQKNDSQYDAERRKIYNSERWRRLRAMKSPYRRYARCARKMAGLYRLRIYTI